MNSKQTVQPSPSKLKKPASVRSNLCLNGKTSSALKSSGMKKPTIPAKSSTKATVKTSALNKKNVKTSGKSTSASGTNKSTAKTSKPSSAISVKFKEPSSASAVKSQETGGKTDLSTLATASISAAPTENAYYEEEEQELYMIYYLLGRIYLRPVAYVTGFVTKLLDEAKPYPLRRSSGCIEVVPFDPANESMAHDHDLVTETGVAPANSRPLAINLSGENAQLAVYGELGSGYLFEAPSTFQLSGQLHIAYWTEEGLAEEALKVPGAVVEVAQGTARLYICDLKHFVLLYDDQSQYTVGLLAGESTQAQVNQAADVLSHIAGSAKPGPTTGGGPRLGRAGKGVRNTGGKKITTTSAAEGSQTLHKAISALGTAKSRSEAVLSTIIAQHITLSNKSSSTSTEAAITASLTNENDVLENSGEAAAVAGSPVLKE